ncbi:hypothetical protein XENOCAPTIV_024888 [Xenoophorus captivus]|uniref:Uncharacterized protein n=1 Tax=Xenoophorus captivus TaxID=1517983 RepID=A0ABV0QWI1_9TELE
MVELWSPFHLQLVQRAYLCYITRGCSCNIDEQHNSLFITTTMVEKTIVQYEEEIDRQRRLLDLTWRPRISLQRAGKWSWSEGGLFRFPLDYLRGEVVCSSCITPPAAAVMVVMSHSIMSLLRLCRLTSSSLNREEPEPQRVEEEERDEPEPLGVKAE